MTITRQQQAITSALEKKILDALAVKIYPYFTANMLTFIGLLGSGITALAFILAARNMVFLYLAIIGIGINWLGDSLDGRVAKLRQALRPRYGFYIDHMVDTLSYVLVFSGIILSNLTYHYKEIWIALLILFLLMMIHSSIKAAATGIHELSFEQLGPTEARIVFIIVTFLVWLTNNQPLLQQPVSLTVLDSAGCFVCLLLFIIFIKAFGESLWGKNKISEDTS